MRERQTQHQGKQPFCLISIHAPRGGSDALNLQQAVYNGTFQSTLPAGGATPTIGEDRRHSIISIHAPRGGSDRRRPEARYEHPISIHAPRGGSDRLRSRGNETHRHFNPRSPRGERPPGWKSKPRPSYFNPRSPRGERLKPSQASTPEFGFQSTLPAGGATAKMHNFIHAFSAK